MIRAWADEQEARERGVRWQDTWKLRACAEMLDEDGCPRYCRGKVFVYFVRRAQ
jgi:hypothetical protein